MRVADVRILGVWKRGGRRVEFALARGRFEEQKAILLEDGWLVDDVGFEVRPGKAFDHEGHEETEEKQ